MSYVNYMSIYMNHLNHITFFIIYKDELETYKNIKTKVNS